ncbi:MAG TPA: ATP-binding cassette domain-containing protein [Thermotogota bacterium]|nr:ATP-binding cassette domain-containing protein [Thermotogota bacterium]HRW92650.1 ATP-binding cassette domain-containing protein [Thermotogota bacterium]
MITVKGIFKTYHVYQGKGWKRRKKEIHALENMDFQVTRGECLGYIGPNGAGKSTTVKILTGIMVPDSGEVISNGYCPWKERKRYVKNIGVVFGQKTQMWWDLPVADSYALLGSLYRVEPRKARKQIDFLVDALQLSEIFHQPVRQLSLGQRMRAEVGAALVHDPDLLFLDEPSIGLDVVSQHNLQNFLKQLNQSGKTIFLTTHNLKEIETLCTRAMVINQGKIIFHGTIPNLKKMTELPVMVKVQLFENPTPEGMEQIRALSGEYDREQGIVAIPAGHEKGVAEITRILMHHLPVEDLRVEEPGIEEIVKAIYLQELSRNRVV